VVIICLLTCDWVGYYRLRQVLQLGLQYQAESRTGPVSSDVYRNILSRTWKFHLILSILGYGYVISEIIRGIGVLKHLNNPEIVTNPDKYSFQVGTTVCILVSTLLTWWAWIPFDFKTCSTIREDPSNVSTNKSSHPNNSSHERPDEIGSGGNVDREGIEVVTQVDRPLSQGRCDQPESSTLSHSGHGGSGERDGGHSPIDSQTGIGSTPIDSQTGSSLGSTGGAGGGRGDHAISKVSETSEESGPSLDEKNSLMTITAKDVPCE